MKGERVRLETQPLPSYNLENIITKILNSQSIQTSIIGLEDI